MSSLGKFINTSISSLNKILGTNINNLSKFMGENISTYVFKDTFTGNNGSDPNSTYWDPSQYFEIQSNQLHGFINNAQGYVSSKFYLANDFDIFVSFNDLITGSTTANRIELITTSSDNEETCVIGARYKTNLKFVGNIRHSGSWYGEVDGDALTSDYGELGVTRIGSTITLKYKNANGEWTTLTSRTIGTVDLYIKLFISSAGGNVSGDFDDFIIDTGTMV